MIRKKGSVGIATSINEGRYHETLHLALHVNTSQILLVMCHIVCLRVGTGIAGYVLWYAKVIEPCTVRIPDYFLVTVMSTDGGDHNNCTISVTTIHVITKCG